MEERGKKRRHGEKEDSIDEDAAAMRDVLKLNVGGKIYTTTRGTLCSDASSMLATKFRPNNEYAPPLQIDGAFFLDRDPEAFKFILNYLRCGCIASFDTTKSEVDMHQLQAEADYFSLQGLSAFCEKTLKEQKEKREVETFESSRRMEGIKNILLHSAIKLNENLMRVTFAIENQGETLSKNLDQIEEVIGDKLEDVSDKMEDISSSIKDIQGTTLSESIESLGEVIERKIDDVSNSLKETQEGSTLSESMTLSESIERLGEVIGDKIERLGENVGEKIEDVSNNIKENQGCMETLGEVIGDKIEDLSGAIPNKFERICFEIENLTNSVEMIPDKLENIENTIERKLDDISSNLEYDVSSKLEDIGFAMEAERETLYRSLASQRRRRRQ